MPGITLREDQLDALARMKNGCILDGDVGSGKSITGLAYYYTLNGGKVNTGRYEMMRSAPLDLYIITTAKKRNTCEWEEELLRYRLTIHPEVATYKHKCIVDSWNNITKYVNVQGAFFIFDEQRAIGSGSWAKTFIKIAQKNKWIMLSATPGDRWIDYAPVFVANGFYRNLSDFRVQHVVYRPMSKYPQIMRYDGGLKLMRLRDRILVVMNYHKKTVQHHDIQYTDYNRVLYQTAKKDRWNMFDQCPIENASQYCYILRKIINTDESKEEAVLDYVAKYGRVIIFYNFDYELDILRRLDYGEGVTVAEYSGHKHEPLPMTDKWVYLVNYGAGSEGWNCIQTKAMIFYSENYSYRMMYQAAGRIDRSNTPYIDLYYLHLRSHADIDMAIARALNSKKKFNEGKYTSKLKFEKVLPNAA